MVVAQFELEIKHKENLDQWEEPDIPFLFLNGRAIREVFHVQQLQFLDASLSSS